jgi:hypothetical protein
MIDGRTALSRLGVRVVFWGFSVSGEDLKSHLNQSVFYRYLSNACELSLNKHCSVCIIDSSEMLASRR